MSALDASVRSYSMERIEADLTWLIDREVPKIKLVDRTFNYDKKRALHIFKFILERNRSSHFHFEIGAHLLDEETLKLLETVPEGMFHFEIGVQSTLPETLTEIDRKVSLDKVLHNIRKLKKRCQIELHLDLIAGLPGEDYQHFLESINTILALEPDHLQIEPVKLLPGSPMRLSAKTQSLHYDPNPPYTIVRSDSLTFSDIEKLKSISRLLDLTRNSGRLSGFMQALSKPASSMAAALELLALHLQNKGLFRLPISQDGLFAAIWDFVKEHFSGQDQLVLQENLARDYALCERVILAKAPGFINTDLTQSELTQIKEKVQQRRLGLQGTNTKLQYFASPFTILNNDSVRRIHLFFYLTRSGQGRDVEEVVFTGDPDFDDLI
jgi:anaerobic magnesium-protoporphyrin IX monomethyl ester cyclase